MTETSHTFSVWEVSVIVLMGQINKSCIPFFVQKRAVLERATFLEIEDIKENIVVIKINKIYREGMSAEELYGVIRGIRKKNIESLVGTEYCLSVYKGEVVEAYQIDEWNPAGTTPMETRIIDSDHTAGRVDKALRMIKVL